MSTFDSARRFLRRVFVVEEEGSEEPRAPFPSRSAAHQAEFQDLVEGLGAEPADEGAVDLEGMELDELRAMLLRLRPLGDELARTEQERASLVERCTGLEKRCKLLEERLTSREQILEDLGTAKDPDPSRREAALTKRLEDREALLGRERERLAQVRQQRDERSKVAADRWRELRAMRSRLRRLEREA